MPDFDTITEMVLNEYLLKVKEEIFSAQRNLGITASGSSELQTKVLRGSNSNRAFLSAPRYLTTNFEGVGRSSGGFPPIDNIKQWIRAKGLRLRNPTTGRFISVDSAAFLIGRKIALQGTDIFTGKRSGIPIKRILRENLPTAGRQLAKRYSQEMVNQVNQAIKR